MFTFTYCRNIEMSAEKPLLENTLYIALKKKQCKFVRYISHNEHNNKTGLLFFFSIIKQENEGNT